MHFETHNSVPIYVSRKLSGHVLLRGTLGMSNGLFLPTAPYFRLQICANVDYKYAWEDAKWLKLRNKISNDPHFLGLGKGP